MSQKYKDHRKKYKGRNPIARFLLEQRIGEQRIKEVRRNPKRDQKITIRNVERIVDRDYEEE